MFRAEVFNDQVAEVTEFKEFKEFERFTGFRESIKTNAAGVDH